MYEFVIKQFLLKYIPVLFNLGRDLWFVHEAPDGMVPIPCAHCSICMYCIMYIYGVPDVSGVERIVEIPLGFAKPRQGRGTPRLKRKLVL